MSIGIDHIAFYAPQQYLSLKDLAAARGVDPLKYTVGIGVQEAAVATAAEDLVVLAANAGFRALSEAGVSPDDIGLLIVGTESSEDKSKPTATHVHELLGINNSCRVYDVVHACAGATYGILSAIDWLYNPDHKYALIIASDIARYGINSQGEPTQGAGAVAMIISRSPRLVSLSEVGNFSKNVYDFWKPLDLLYPLVDGAFSAKCYAKAAEACFKKQNLSEEAAYIYHVPYPKLVHQTHTLISRLIGANLDGKQHFQKKVSSSCLYASKIGNIYTGSLWLSLMSFLDTYYTSSQANHILLEEFDGCYLFSYGSGCGAALLRGHFAQSWDKQVSHFKFDDFFKSRIQITVKEYEDCVNDFEHPESVTEERMSQMSVGGEFRYCGKKDNKRSYSRNNNTVMYKES